MKIAFWNINKKNLSDLLVDFVKENEIDVLLLAETGDGTVVLDFIKKQKKMNPGKRFSEISNAKVFVLSSYSEENFKIKPSKFSSRWNGYTITIPTIIKFNLFCVHFPSKVNWSAESLALECVNLSREIEEFENETGIFETIVIGDFNMNPYENGLVAANGLHALPDINYLLKKSEGRVVNGIKYKYFYNPMWNHFGDGELPLGTYYYRESGHISQEWNIYDQVIYRPSFDERIKKNSLKIIFQIQTENLLDAMKRPDKENYSDHLPILIEINT
jgi:hypothetical protein